MGKRIVMTTVRYIDDDEWGDWLYSLVRAGWPGAKIAEFADRNSITWSQPEHNVETTITVERDYPFERPPKPLTRESEKRVR